MFIRIWADKNRPVPAVYEELDGEYQIATSFKELVQILNTAMKQYQDIEVIDIDLDQDIYEDFSQWEKENDYIFYACPHNDSIIRNRIKNRYARYWRT